MLQQTYPPVIHGFRYELNKDMNFAAAHFVPHVDAGVCQNMHGHTYFINITVAGDELDHTGFLVNFKALKDLVHKRFDHTILNYHHTVFDDEIPYLFPTTEVVAKMIWYIVQRDLQQRSNKPRCLQVYVRETPTSYVVFRPNSEDWNKIERNPDGQILKGGE